MGILRRLFGRKYVPSWEQKGTAGAATTQSGTAAHQEAGLTPLSAQHAVIVRLQLEGGAFGSPGERGAIEALEDQLINLLENSRLGEFDGNEIGGGEYALYMYGPDADRLFSILEPVLRSSPAADTGVATLRYGEPDDPDVKERQVVWGSTQ